MLMIETYEEWLVEAAKNETFSLLAKVPGYTEAHCGKMRNPAAERRRLADYIRDYAPRTAFTAMLITAVMGQ